MDRRHFNIYTYIVRAHTHIHTYILFKIKICEPWERAIIDSFLKSPKMLSKGAIFPWEREISDSFPKTALRL